VTQRLHVEDELALDLFAGMPVTNYAAALPWYERFFGGRPSFLPNDIEAVWEVAEHRYVYIVQDPERAGNALVLSFVDDLDRRVAELARQGIEPAQRLTLDNGVTKVTYRDADGNEISLGGAPKGLRNVPNSSVAFGRRPQEVRLRRSGTWPTLALGLSGVSRWSPGACGGRRRRKVDLRGPYPVGQLRDPAARHQGESLGRLARTEARSAQARLPARRHRGAGTRSQGGVRALYLTERTLQRAVLLGRRGVWGPASANLASSA
jgi:hypothetical protein